MRIHKLRAKLRKKFDIRKQKYIFVDFLFGFESRKERVGKLCSHVWSCAYEGLKRA